MVRWRVGMQLALFACSPLLCLALPCCPLLCVCVTFALIRCCFALRCFRRRCLGDLLKNISTNPSSFKQTGFLQFSRKPLPLQIMSFMSASAFGCAVVYLYSARPCFPRLFAVRCFAMRVGLGVQLFSSALLCSALAGFFVVRCVHACAPSRNIIAHFPSLDMLGDRTTGPQREPWPSHG